MQGLAATKADPAPWPLIPMPARVELGQGEHRVTAQTPLRYHDARSQAVAQYLSGLLERSLGLSMAPVPAAAAGVGPGIDLVIEGAEAGLPREGYRLTVDDRRIAVTAGDAAGLFYGATTLWQLLTAARAEAGATGARFVQALAIEDAPRFGWRGYMLDSARHFHGVDEIKRVLDAMAVHKLNVFHWHLTDDQGWRIQILKYPRLTEIGGCRTPGGDAGSDPRTGAPRRYCGWYTQAQIRDIVAYAAERHITVVPEIDMPGHATAAIAAYPELGVSGAPMAVSNQRGIHSNLFNVQDRTFDFLEEVLTEVMQLFPSTYLHIGGDEAVKEQWQASPQVQARMRELGVADEAALQSWFIRRLERMLTAHGRRLIGWDEILEGGLPAEATVMSWRGIEGGIEAARQGHDVVMSPVSAMYLDYLQTGSPNEPAGRPKLIPLETFYAFEPVPEALEASQRKHVLGLQANMWTGDTRSFAGVQHNTFPRLAAVAETGWSPAAAKDYASFLQRLPEQLRRYRMLGIGYASTPFEVVLDQVLPEADGRARVSLSNPLGYGVRYTLDGSTPRADSPQYRQPLQLALPVTVRAAAFAAGQALAPVDEFRIDAASLRERTDEGLAVCSQEGPVLRMEDDGPADGPRALFNVNIFTPCWQWRDAPLEGVAAIRVRAGRLPYLIQLGAEDGKRRFLPARTAHGELDIRLDDCDGPLLATAPLPAGPDGDGFATVQAALSAPVSGLHDLCIRFSGDTRPAMWVLDRITLLPSLPE